jgi:hypothetical protein
LSSGGLLGLVGGDRKVVWNMAKVLFQERQNASEQNAMLAKFKLLNVMTTKVKEEQ